MCRGGWGAGPISLARVAPQSFLTCQPALMRGPSRSREALSLLPVGANLNRVPSPRSSCDRLLDAFRVRCRIW